MRLLTLAVAIMLASALTAAAQTPPADDDAEMPAAEDAAVAPDVNDPDIMKDIDVSKLDWSQLNVEASTLTGPAAKGRAAPKGASADAAWSNNAKPNGQRLNPNPSALSGGVAVERQEITTTDNRWWGVTLK